MVSITCSSTTSPSPLVARSPACRSASAWRSVRSRGSRIRLYMVGPSTVESHPLHLPYQSHAVRGANHALLPDARSALATMTERSMELPRLIQGLSRPAAFPSPVDRVD